MGMKMLVEGVSEVADSVWSASIPPHDLQRLGSPKATVGTRSILLAEGTTYDRKAALLHIDVGTIYVLNLGTTADVIIVASGQRVGELSHQSSPPSPASEASSGPGDREFLNLVERELSGEARDAAKSILREVRRRYPGDLQRGQRTNFKNTPDNFWYVIVQPRVQSLSVTVRGERARFVPSTLLLKEDRPGYTRFKLERSTEVAEAMRIIEHSKRRG